MIKLLIVDDEILIREGIKNGIPWNDHSIMITGIAENGIEALKSIEICVPDIIITDINMPEMDGLELIQYLRQMNIDIRFIILTGYNEFEYARQCIELGVSNYVLKPVDPELLLHKVVDIGKQLVEEEKHKKEYGILKKRFEHGIPLLKEKLYEEVEKNNSAGDTDQLVKSRVLIQEIKQYLTAHFCENLSLSQISERFMLSYTYMSQVFKKETGYTVTEYMNILRIEKAKELLGDPLVKIYEIGYHVGIDDNHYFTRLFKKYTGISPKEFRNGIRK